MLKQQVQMQNLVARMRERLTRDDGVSMVEGMVYAGAMALAVIAIVAVVQTWGIGKANSLP